MPTLKKARKVILTLIPNNKSIIYELGSGWGHLALLLSKYFPNAYLKAFELSPIPWFVSLMCQKMMRINNLKIQRKNFHKVSLHDAEVVVCYLYPGAMISLKDKFQKELKKGTFIISHTFAIPGWIPKKEFLVNDLWQSTIYVYEIQ